MEVRGATREAVLPDMGRVAAPGTLKEDLGVRGQYGRPCCLTRAVLACDADFLIFFIIFPYVKL